MNINNYQYRGPSAKVVLEIVAAINGEKSRFKFYRQYGNVLIYNLGNERWTVHEVTREQLDARTKLWSTLMRMKGVQTAETYRIMTPIPEIITDKRVLLAKYVMCKRSNPDNGSTMCELHKKGIYPLMLRYCSGPGNTHLRVGLEVEQEATLNEQRYFRALEKYNIKSIKQYRLACRYQGWLEWAELHTNTMINIKFRNAKTTVERAGNFLKSHYKNFYTKNHWNNIEKKVKQFDGMCDKNVTLKL